MLADLVVAARCNGIPTARIEPADRQRSLIGQNAKHDAGRREMPLA